MNQIMYLVPDIRLQNRLMRWSRYLIIPVILIAVLVLVGWQTGSSFLKAPFNKVVAMNPVTATCFILSSLSFLLATRAGRTRPQVLTAYLLAGLVLLVAVLRIMALTMGTGIDIDRWLFPEQLAHPIEENIPAYMAPFTAFSFFLTAITLVLVNARLHRNVLAAQLISLAIGLTALLSLLGYIYQESAFFGSPHVTPMALHTAVCFILLSVAFLFSTADSSAMQQFTSTLTGSVTSRALVPAAVIVPAVIGLIRLYGNRAGLYSNEFGVAVFAVAITIVLLVLIWYNTVSLNRRDIAKKMIEKELEKGIEQNAYLASLLENTSDAVFSTDAAFNIKSWNRAAEKLYGYTAQEAIGATTMELIKTDFTGKERASVRKSLAETGTFKAEYKHYSKDGAVLDLLISATAIRDTKGGISSYVCICHDISEAKKLQDQLRKSNAELEAFTYSVSHDLRAPLRGIIGFTAILEEEYSSKLDEEARRLTGLVKSNALRMGNLIDDLLNFSRLGKQEINKIPVDSSAIVKQVIEEMGNKQRVTWKIQPLPVVEADANMIRQVWMNLIDNAVKYSQNNEAPVVEIGACKKDGQTVFYVKDNGVGFDQQYAGKLFKVFQRLHSVHEFEGTGVGLALIEKIISRHGGRIWAKGEVNKGAVFSFTL